MILSLIVKISIYTLSENTIIIKKQTSNKSQNLTLFSQLKYTIQNMYFRLFRKHIIPSNSFTPKYKAMNIFIT